MKVFISLLCMAVILTFLLVWAFKLNDIKNDILEKVIKEGLKSGIWKINYPNQYEINIFFKNGTSIINGWNCNKYYSWLDKGKIVGVNGFEYAINRKASYFTLRKLDKAICRFIKKQIFL